MNIKYFYINNYKNLKINLFNFKNNIIYELKMTKLLNFIIFT